MLLLLNKVLSLLNKVLSQLNKVRSCDKLLLLLRSLKDGASDVLPADLATNVDCVAPFILSLDSKTPRLVLAAANCLQKLVSHTAVPPSTISEILRALSEHTDAQMEVQVKILQTVLPLVSNYSIHGQTLADTLLLAHSLHDTKSPIVSNTASTTLRQMIIITFEKIATANNIASEDGTIDRELYLQDGINIFQVLTIFKPGYLLFAIW